MLRRAATALLFVVVALALVTALLPKLLDRTYYRGPISDHFDGTRFFNPGEATQARRGSAMMARFFSGVGKAEWPAAVPVTPTRPAAVTDPRSMVATWIGHATVLVQAGGINVLTDPIYADRASPVTWAGPRRARAPGVRLADLPRIDVIIVSHNHYDHMDLPTLKALWERDRPLIVTSLGNDAVIRQAGVPSLAMDWGDSQDLVPGCIKPSAATVPEYRRIQAASDCIAPAATVTVERNHHWGSRFGADRNRALWSSFTIDTPAGAIYFAGDTGFGNGRWAAERASKAPVRLAILPIGAYEPRDAMKGNHVNPAEAVRLFDQLRPALALGVHWGTFQLTFEGIDAPRRALARARGARRFVTTEVGRSVVVPELGVD